MWPIKALLDTRPRALAMRITVSKPFHQKAQKGALIQSVTSRLDRSHRLNSFLHNTRILINEGRLARFRFATECTVKVEA